jgi:hypothetical protein
VLCIWPILVYSHAQENQANDVYITDNSQVKVIGNLTENPMLIGVSNDFYPNTLLDFILIGSGIATMFFVFLLWRQNKHTETSMKLSYGPVIHGRFGKKDGFPKLFLKNYGRGPALDVQINIVTPDGTILDRVKRFALTPDDGLHPTKVDLSKTPKVYLKGTIKDVNFETKSVDHELNYPLMEEIEEHEEISEDKPDEE